MALASASKRLIPVLSRPPDVSFGLFSFDPHSRLLRREGVEVPLPPRVLGVLELLLSRAGDIVPRRELMETVWKDSFVTDTSLAEAISFLRQALGDDPQSPRYIQTVHRRGYRFLPLVQAEESPGLQTRPTDETLAEPAIQVSHDIVAWGIAILSLIGAVSAMWFATRQEPVVPPVVQLQVEAGEGLIFDDRPPAVAMSRNAEAMAWSACAARECRIFTRTMANAAAKALDGTSGAAAPFFSPDGRWIGFFADGKLKKVLLQGGPPVVIADAPHPGGAAWMRDGRIVFNASIAGGLLRVSDGGGAVEVLTQPDVEKGELRHGWPTANAAGSSLTFLAATSGVSGAPGRLALLDYGPRPAIRVLVDNVTAGALMGNEFVVYVRGQQLFAQPYDASKQEIRGGEQVVGSGIRAPHVVVSPNGAVAYVAETATDPDSRPPQWRWSSPTAPGTAPVPSLIDAVLAPSGSRVAGIAPDSAAQLWTADLTRGTTTRLTDAVPAASPAWSADDGTVFYASKPASHYEIWSRNASANGEARKVLSVTGRHIFPTSAVRERVAYVEAGPEGANVGIVELSGGKAQLVASTRFDEVAPALSPDGRRLAYQSNESGRWEVVLLDLASGRRVPVSSNGGTRPLWSHDGRSLYFESNGDVLRAAVTPSGELEGRAAVVQTLQSERLVGVAADGRLLLERLDHTPATRAVVTLEWIRDLRRTVGPPPVALPR